MKQVGRWAAVALGLWVSLAAQAQILIGQTAGFSGAVAAGVKETTDGAKLYLDAINAQGGVNGQKIELVQMDDKFDPKLAAENAKVLITEKNVAALFFSRGTPQAQAIMPVLEKNKVPLIGPSTGAMVLHKPVHPWVFNVRATYQREAERAVQHLSLIGMERIGVKTLIECSHRVQPDQGHASRQLARPLEKLAMFVEDSHLQAVHFERREVIPGRIAIHVGSGSEKKNWPLEHWLALADDFRDHDVIFVTGEAEQERGMLIENRPSWHSLPLPELASRLSTCAAFFGHDSGISHLAAACGVPSLLLFGPTDPAVWAPPQPWVTILRSENGDLASLEDQRVKLAARQVVSKT